MSTKLTFLGAAQNVTGSRYLLDVDGYRVLVDCGLYQERQLRYRNWEPFPVPPSSINAIVLTHAHLDHCGFIPRLVRDGFNGVIYCTPATAEIARIELLDSAHLQEEDARFKQRRHERENRRGPHPEVPLYTTEDALAAFPRFAGIEYNHPIHLNGNIEVRFFEAGHVLGSGMAQVSISAGGQTRTIVFSGDIGRLGLPMLRDPATFEQADYVLVESTYGNRVLGSTQEAVDGLVDVINRTHKAGGNIVIPSFALERAQDLLYYLNKCLMADRIPHLMVFLDSPMAVNIVDVFRNHPELFDEEMAHLVRNGQSPFDFPGLKLVRTVDESKAINYIKGTVIIIAGSGMCVGGRIKHHLAVNIARPESTILFVGYQAVGTLGREIVDGAAEVRVLGQYLPVRAKIVQLSGFSGHADKEQLFGWLSHISPPRELFVVHGEADSSQEIAALVREKLGWQVSVPAYGEQVELG